MFVKKMLAKAAYHAGLVGPQGPQGEPGVQGPQGAPGKGLPELSLEWEAVDGMEDSRPAPSRSHGQDAGWDLPTLRPFSIASGQRVTVDTGWAIRDGLPAGTVGLVMDRSGLASEYGITVLGGVVDPGYTGSIKVVLYNSGPDRVQFGTGDRVAQFVVLPAYTGQDTSHRGGAGLGSTGTAARTSASETAPLHPVQERKRRLVLREGGSYTSREVMESYRPGMVLRDSDGDYWTRLSNGKWGLIGNQSGPLAAQIPLSYSTLGAYYGPYTPVATPEWYTSQQSPQDADAGADNEDTTVDPVNHPAHYTDHPVFSGEAWDYTRRMSFAAGNPFKYAWRCMDKGNPLEDLSKASWYVTHATDTDWGTTLLHLWDVQGLHSALQDYVQRHPALVAYYTELDGQGGLDSPAPASVEVRSAEAVRLVVAAEAYTAVVFIARGDRSRAQAALDRAVGLARHL